MIFVELKRNQKFFNQTLHFHGNKVFEPLQPKTESHHPSFGHLEQVKIIVIHHLARHTIEN